MEEVRFQEHATLHGSALTHKILMQSMEVVIAITLKDIAMAAEDAIGQAVTCQEMGIAVHQLVNVS